MESRTEEVPSEAKENSLSPADVVNENSEAPSSTPSVETPSQQPKNPLFMADDTLHIPEMAKDVIEYEWPVNSGDKWLLQIKNDSKRLAELREKALKTPELREKALKSASEYNKEIQTRKKGKKRFLDTQTSVIQGARNRYKVLPPQRTKSGSYPVALLSGQYQTYYKKFSPEEMKNLPLGPVTLQDEPPREDQSSSSITVSRKEKQRERSRTTRTRFCRAPVA